MLSLETKRKRTGSTGELRKENMKMISSNSVEKEKLGLPRNLNEWVGDLTLLGLAFDSVQTVHWDLNEKALQTSGPFRPQMLLTLLTYCYSRGIYGSQEIVQAIQQDKNVRYICAHNYPDWHLLRKFRRHSRAQLEQSLKWVLQQAWAKQCDAAQADYLGYDWFEDYLNVELDAAVQQRLELAILMDGVESD
jgi:hypothetical protein